jgi:hypothetical protein
MGSLHKNPKDRASKINGLKTMYPLQGDLCIFSWRQWHCTHTPRYFPTKQNLHMHFMLSPRENDVAGFLKTHIYPEVDNDALFAHYTAPKGFI